MKTEIEKMGEKMVRSATFVSDLLDQAMKARGLKSRRELAAALGITNTSVNDLYHGNSYPKDKTAIEIAKLAGCDPVTTLLKLKVAQSEKEETGYFWREALRRIDVTALAVLLGVFLFQSNAIAAPSPVTSQNSVMHIMENNGDTRLLSYKGFSSSQVLG